MLVTEILQYIKKGVLENVMGVEQRPITLEEAKAAKEVFLTSTTLLVQGITHWDEDIIADGEVRSSLCHSCSTNWCVLRSMGSWLSS